MPFSEWRDTFVGMEAEVCLLGAKVRTGSASGEAAKWSSSQANYAPPPQQCTSAPAHSPPHPTSELSCGFLLV